MPLMLAPAASVCSAVATACSSTRGPSAAASAARQVLPKWVGGLQRSSDPVSMAPSARPGSMAPAPGPSTLSLR